MSVGLAGAIFAGTAVIATLLSLAMPDPSLPAVRATHPDADALANAGWTAGLRRWETIRATCIALSLVFVLTWRLPVIIVGVAAVAPSVWARLRADSARDRGRRAFGRIIASTAAALRSGVSLPDALRRGIDATPDPLAARPLREALRAFDLGGSLDVALGDVAGRCGDERAGVAIGSLALGIRERLPRERIADLIDAIAERIAFEERLEHEVRARAAGARQQQWVLAAVVPALALYLTATMPMLGTTLGSELGRFVLIPAAAALEVIGIVAARRVVRGALG